MNFRTIVAIRPSEKPVDHSQGLVFIGSCFAENIGRKFKDAKFRTDINPFGALYNPLSIASALRRLISGKPYKEKDLFFDNGQWYSASHHSTFSDKDKAVCLQKINSRLIEASENLRNARHLFITFGTAWVYEWAENGGIVGNCHKLPAKNFVRRRLGVDEIIAEFNAIISELLVFNSNLNIIFTVSPIRHWKDGAHENSLSKSTLLLAIDASTMFGNRNCVHYFPAYEIVNDDLRDYRFYASDMIHLSDVAVDYIWEHVCETFFSANTRKIIDEITQLNKARQHRPFNPDSEEYQNFLKKIEKLEHRLYRLYGISQQNIL